MKTLAGTRGLIRLILRRDRFLMPLWILILGVLPGSYAATFAGLYPDPAQQATFAASIANNPALTSLYGPMYGSSIGALAAWRANMIPVIAAIIGAFVVIRHTRVEEEAGRRELLGSTVVGRHAPLAAALITTTTGMLLLGLITAAGLAGNGAGGSGAVAFGLSVALVGCVFAAIGAVAAQLTESARTARGIVGTVLGAAFLLRVADLPWISPIGWQLETRSYAAPRWWVLMLPVALTVVAMVAVFRLAAGRDIGAGVLATGNGKADAGSGFRSPIALAWRLHRGSLIGWTLSLGVIGAVVGSMAKDVAIFAESEAMRQILERLGGPGALSDAFFTTSFGLVSIGVAVYASVAALRARGEEAEQRAEPVLATAVGRLRWAGSHLVFAFAGPLVLMLALGIGAGLTYESAKFGRTVAAALVPLPAIWVVGGIAVALFGLLPRFTAAIWGFLGVFLLFGQLGDLLRLPQATMNLSPFSHIPALPGADASPIPLVWLAVCASGLTLAGLTGLRRRDIG